MPPASRGLGQLLLLARQPTYYAVTCSPPPRIRYTALRSCAAGHAPANPHMSPPHHAFSTSVRLQKKGSSHKKSKAAHAADKDSSSSSSSSSSNVSSSGGGGGSSDSAAAVDPFDHSTLQAAIDRAISRLKDNLARSRDAGRVSVAMIEALPVEFGGGGKEKTQTRIGAIASVVPKGGRSMQVFCAEEGHVKAVMSALQASDYSLTPQLESNNNTSTAGSANPLVITVPVPPVTAETRQQAAAEAKKAAEKAGLEVRNARGEAQKRFRKMELEKRVVVDELRKAHKGMEEVARQGQEQVKAVLDAALKALAR